MKDKVLNLIDQFISAHEPDWIHIKLQSSKGQSELFLPFSETKSEQSVSQTDHVPESTLAKLTRIQAVLPQERPQSGDDFEWFKQVQLQLGGNQIMAGDSPDLALNKMRDQGLTIYE